MTTDLTQAVLCFQKTQKGWDALFDEITIYVYEFPFRWTNWNEDRCSEFFLSFQPRIPGLVQRFQPHFTFETYLACTLRWYMKTFTNRLADKEHYDSWSEREFGRRLETLGDTDPEQMGDFEFAGSQWSILSENCPLELDEAGRIKDATLRRRVLFAVLLQTADIDAERLPAIATIVDVDPDWLQETVEKARTVITDKMDRRGELRHRRNEYWYRMECAEKRLRSDGSYDENARKIWEKKSRTWKKRYLSACESIRRLKVTPSHRDIAALLNLPPGTVASGLHFLRKQWHAIEEDGDLNHSRQRPGNHR